MAVPATRVEHTCRLLMRRQLSSSKSRYESGVEDNNRAEGDLETVVRVKLPPVGVRFSDLKPHAPVPAVFPAPQ